jgi:hypothetical protein
VTAVPFPRQLQFSFQRCDTGLDISPRRLVRRTSVDVGTAEEGAESVCYAVIEHMVIEGSRERGREGEKRANSVPTACQQRVLMPHVRLEHENARLDANAVQHT